MFADETFCFEFNIILKRYSVIFFSFFQKWEILVLSRLKWDQNAVIGRDFVDFIIDRLNLVILSVVSAVKFGSTHSASSLCAPLVSFFFFRLESIFEWAISIQTRSGNSDYAVQCKYWKLSLKMSCLCSSEVWSWNILNIFLWDVQRQVFIFIFSYKLP